MNILKASVIYRALDRVLESIIKSMKESFVFGLLCSLWFGLSALFAQSFCGKTWEKIDRSFKTLPERSFFLGKFLSPVKEKEDSSLIGGFCRKIMGVFFGLYQKSAVLQFFANRKLLHPAFWCIVTVFLTPLLPTMMVLGLVLFSALSLFLAKAKKQEPFFAKSSMNRPVFFFALLYVLSTAAAWGRGANIQITAIILAFTLFSLVLVSAITTKEQLHYLLFFLLVGGVLTSFLGLFQYFFGPLLGDSSWVDNDMFDISMRVYATFENPNILGAYFLFVIPFALAAFFAVKEPLLRLASLFALAIMALVLALTFSRGAYLGIVVAFAVFFVLLDRRMIFLGIIALVAAYFILPEAMLDRFFSIGNMEDTSTAYRVSIWLGTLDIVRDHLFLGIGPGLDTWERIYPLYAHAAAVAHHSHMLFLQVLTELGLVGFVLFLAILYQFYKNSFATFYRGTKEGRYWSMAAISAVSGFLVMGLAEYALFNYRLRLLFWFVLALGVLIGKVQDENGARLEVSP